jgi:hypothetical protein
VALEDHGELNNNNKLKETTQPHAVLAPKHWPLLIQNFIKDSFVKKKITA